jgi:hypothetical protein
LTSWSIGLTKEQADDFLSDRIDGLRQIAAQRGVVLQDICEAELAKRAAAKEAAERAKEQAELEAKEAAERRRDQLDRWVSEHGNQLQQTMHSRGLLSDQKIEECIRNEAFAPLAGYERYERIKASDVCEYGEKVFFQVYDAETVDESVFAKVLEIEQALPGAETTVRRHRGTCQCVNCSAVMRLGIRVEMTIGDLVLTREYAA